MHSARNHLPRQAEHDTRAHLVGQAQSGDRLPCPIRQNDQMPPALLDFMAKAAVVSTVEEDRRQLTWKALREIFGGSLHSERNRDGSLTDGVHIIEIGDVGVCVLVIEVKRKMGEGGSDATIQVSISFRKNWVFGEVSLILDVYFKASQFS